MSVILQSFTVKFEYKTYFTENVFFIGNELFKQVIAEDGGHGKRKLLFIIDDGVAKAHPYLPTQIEQYCHQYPAVLDLKGEILIVQGGEAVKNSDEEVKKNSASSQ